MLPSRVKPEAEPVESSFTLVDSLNEQASQSDEPAPSALIIENSPLVENLYEGPKKCRCCINWVDRIPTEAEADSESDDEGEKTPIVIRYSVTRGEDASRVSIHSIQIQDPAARKVLFSVFEGFDRIHPEINCLVFRAPFKPFFYRWQRFQEAIEACKDPHTVEILTQIRRVVKSELAEAFTAEKELVANGLISFPHLWIIFRPGELVCEENSNGTVFYYLESAQDFERPPELRLYTQGVDYDGFRFGLCAVDFSIYWFQGVKKIVDLSVYPARFVDNFEEAKKASIERGRKFQALMGVHYKEYPDVDPQGDGKQENRYSRVMIDTRSHHFPKRVLSIFRPEEDMACDTNLITQVPVDIQPVTGHKPLFKSKRRESRSSDRESYRDAYDSPDDRARDRRIRPTRRIIRARSRSLTPVAQRRNGSRSYTEELTDFHFQICSITLPGFSLKRRRWETFLVDKIRDIEWSADPFNTLVLPDGYKDLILSFVESHIEGEKSFGDVISGKGSGLVALLTGPPGVGKTLTAESVAETLRVPIYLLDLGQVIIELDEERYPGARVDPEKVKIQDAFRLAERWNAILLVDECDLYLEPRSESSPLRNRVVTKFLHEIEYSSSLLFLTTNRPDALDPALASRIHLTVTYPALDLVTRRTIWETFLSHNDCPRLQPSALDALAKVTLNGRRIRNVVRAASIMAGRNKRSVEFKDIKTVLQITEGKTVDEERET